MHLIRKWKPCEHFNKAGIIRCLQITHLGLVQSLKSITEIISYDEVLIHNHVSDFHSHQKRESHTKNSNISMSVAKVLNSAKNIILLQYRFFIIWKRGSIDQHKNSFKYEQVLFKNQKLKKNKIKWQTKSALMLQKSTWPPSK